MEKGHKDGGCWCITQTPAIEKRSLLCGKPQGSQQSTATELRSVQDSFDDAKDHVETTRPMQTVDTSFPASRIETEPSLSRLASSFASLTARKSTTNKSKDLLPHQLDLKH